MSVPGAGPGSLLPFALRLAAAAEAEILPRLRQTRIEHKADGSEVTEADRAAEAAMRELIAREHPDHGILGEEGGEADGAGRYRWILDPLDGTAWFALGVPKFGTLVALAEGDEPVLGVIHMPATAETMWAERGGGCWYRDGDLAPRRVRVDASVTRLEQAYVSSSGVHETEMRPGRRERPLTLREVTRRAARLRFVGDCLQHLLVARGRLHAAIDARMAPWDSAALVPCLREAGATLSTVDGDGDPVFGGSLLAASTPELHAEILGLLHEGRD